MVRISRRIGQVAAGAALVALAPSAASAADAYLKLGDIKGEAKDSARKGEIEVLSWSWGATQVGGAQVATGDLDGDGRADVAAGATPTPREAGSGMATGKRQHNPVRITKEWGGRSATGGPGAPPPSGTMTFRGRVTGCAVGTTSPTATLTASGRTYEFRDVVITSCGAGGTEGVGGAPTEEVSFSYAKVSVRGWDVKKNEK